MMKKRIVAIALLVALALAPSLARASVNMDLFDSAKSALSYISYGEYAKALKALGLPSGKADAKKLKSAVQDGLETALYGEVQTKIAVCYKTDKGYRLCVPVEDPSVGGVEAFVALVTKDGESFRGYATAMWSDCVASAEKSKDTTWCDAVKSAEPMIVAD